MQLVSSGAAQYMVWPEETREVFIWSEVVGVAKVVNNYNDLVKGSLTRQKLQNSKVYAKSLEFSPALGLIIYGKKAVATNLGKLIPSSLNYIFFVHIYLYHVTSSVIT